METIEIIEGLTKTGKTKSEILIEKLKTLKGFSWDNNGEVTMDGKLHKGSNIKDLISNASKSRKNFIPPTGWDQFVDVLKDGNISQSIIGNTKLKKQITNSTPRQAVKKSLIDVEASTSYNNDGTEDDNNHNQFLVTPKRIQKRVTIGKKRKMSPVLTDNEEDENPKSVRPLSWQGYK